MQTDHKDSKEWASYCKNCKKFNPIEKKKPNKKESNRNEHLQSIFGIENTGLTVWDPLTGDA